MRGATGAATSPASRGRASPVRPGRGAIGSARWRGARLADVLRLAGLRRDAVDVLPRGLDADYVTADGMNLGQGATPAARREGARRRDPRVRDERRTPAARSRSGAADRAGLDRHRLDQVGR
ncbi:molybdopterin-dependent oxidoreductase [Streptomyces sp. KL116D]|uniref:molybdopterin-dependent oxidoreductase n=1 Tax=Streptomyces sp. KL116D TaxID=3045152 RepID=UPI003557D80E